MITLTERELEVVKNILHEHIPHCRVAVFGSRTKKTTKPFADIDLLIYSEAPLSLNILTSLKNAFSESDLLFRVDVLEATQTSPEFLKEIEPKAIIIQEEK